MIIKSFFSFSTRELRSVHNKTQEKPSKVKKLTELIRDKKDKGDLN